MLLNNKAITLFSKTLFIISAALFYSSVYRLENLVLISFLSRNSRSSLDLNLLSNYKAFTLLLLNRLFRLLELLVAFNSSLFIVLDIISIIFCLLLSSFTSKYFVKLSLKVI